MYISLGILSLICVVVFNLFTELVSGPFCDAVFVILSVILLPTKTPVVSAVFCNALFQTVFSASVATLVTSDFLVL